MSRIVPLSVAQAGMVLAEPASAGGMVLLVAGAPLTLAHLTMLRDRGVRTVALVEPDSKRAALDAKTVLATDKALRPRFVRLDLKHPALKEMYRLSLLRHARNGTFVPGGADAR